LGCEYFGWSEERKGKGVGSQRLHHGSRDNAARVLSPKGAPGVCFPRWAGGERKEEKKRKRTHVRPQLSLGNSRFGAWNAGAAAERLHPAPLPHRRGLGPAAALPSLKQNNYQKKSTTKAKKEETEKKRRAEKKERNKKI